MLRILIKTESRYPVERKQIRELARFLLKKHGIEDEAEVSIAFVGDRKMKSLSKKFMDREETTDVLSFPLTNDQKREEEGFFLPPDEILRLGDIVVSYPQARRQAIERNITVDEEINILVKHGLLHLLGIHHN